MNTYVAHVLLWGIGWLAAGYALRPFITSAIDAIQERDNHG